MITRRTLNKIWAQVDELTLVIAQKTNSTEWILNAGYGISESTEVFNPFLPSYQKGFVILGRSKSGERREFHFNWYGEVLGVWEVRGSLSEGKKKMIWDPSQAPYNRFCA